MRANTPSPSGTRVPKSKYHADKNTNPAHQTAARAQPWCRWRKPQHEL